MPSDYAARRADVETDATSDFTPFGERVSSESAGSDESVFEVRGAGGVLGLFWRCKRGSG